MHVDPAQRPSVLFVCVHNAGRSQMAAGFLDRIGEGRVRVHSSGSEPADRLNPVVVEAMAERGIDIASESPRRLSDELVAEADVVVTMGCGDACPVYPGKRYEDWELADPAGRDLEAVREIRDEIESRVRELIESLLG
jgi:arsenate reductase